MSKITPKNLSYNNTLPPFLQRLQANNTSSNGRHEFTISRPSKVRDEDEEKESEPVVFDEVSGETLSKEEWERREKEKEEEEEEEGKDGVEGEGEGDGEGKETAVSTKIAVVGSGIGAGKKRKVGKIIGGSEDDDEDGERTDNGVPNKKDFGERKKEKSTKTGAGEKKKPKAAAKKGKKIKLSFGDDE
ncbi:hypothetical protein OCU04_002997 [Sclerotinia nivalis]|uniref:DUF4604 domain-containing protein n=1 Tax=Sclerotinia nivalis TaxID=352851 RepID=A0A9X0AUT0_9HELO|nr:hypothetical protein OCU04_002997 [Sclerotinia nivalis]